MMFWSGCVMKMIIYEWIALVIEADTGLWLRPV